MINKPRIYKELPRRYISDRGPSGPLGSRPNKSYFGKEAKSVTLSLGLVKRGMILVESNRGARDENFRSQYTI